MGLIQPPPREGRGWRWGWWWWWVHRLPAALIVVIARRGKAPGRLETVRLGVLLCHDEWTGFKDLVQPVSQPVSQQAKGNLGLVYMYG